MSNLSGTNLASKIVPFTPDDTYPTHDSLYGAGGHREVATTAERDGIPEARRKLGMLCYVQELDDTFKLTESGWESFSSPVGSVIDCGTFF